uniref:ABC transporter domain-containing protein n=1 Tax=Esox lucius TaxID=8010 RepID=A0A3P8XSG8_ESOLU
MAGFFQQLRLLLWKNGLGVIRQPGWTVALLVWPLVIFIILAITRSQFPPQARKTCYVAPRNLPSAGFFPFLQTLMCNTDSSCHSQSRLFTKSVNRTRRSTWTKHDLMLSSEMQGTVGLLLQMVKFLTDMMGKMLPAISHLQDHLLSIRDLNLVSDPEFQQVCVLLPPLLSSLSSLPSPNLLSSSPQMVHGQTSSMSSKATFITVTRALCSHGIMSLFGISKLPNMMGSDPSTQREHRMDELIDKFKIPPPFCMNLYLDMVNTTGGAIAWAFLKPMLLGQVLYSPDTPLTRAIMEKVLTLRYLLLTSYILHLLSLFNIITFNTFFLPLANMTTLLEKNKNIVTQITTLSNLMMNLSSCINFDRFHGLNSTDELNARAEHLTQTRDLYASILFKLPKDNDDESSRKRRDAPGSSSSTLPPKVDYTIRMSIENSMRTDRTRNPFWIKDPYISSMNTLRYNRGFVYLQESIDRAIIETQTGQQVTEPAVQVQAFPYPCYMKDEYLNSISFVFPLALMVAWVLFIANFVKKLVHERELRLHEYMKMMGVNPMSHFFAWFIESACFLIVTIIILTFILKAGQILPKSDGFLLFLYLSDYGLSILAISFLVSSFFDQTNIAGLSGSLIYLISFFPFIIVMSMENSLSFFTKSALSLFAPTCFSYASQYISRYEIQGEGIQWSNQYTSPLADDKSSFGWLCWLLLIDSLCYFIIGAYIRLVFPGKYGIAKPWYFPVMPSFWTGMFCCCSESPKKVNRGLLFANILKSNISDSSPSHMEEEVSGLPVGVALYGLTKTYGDRAAIENLSVKFYEGQVTALLGHNGAGKTTTMSLLTGLFAPSSGTIEVYGKDMGRNIDDVRQELGVCMQYDVHFDHMTAKEHLLLYGQMKAPHWSPRELQDQVRKILEETGMYSHRHKRVGTLSGGMKRKLSISIAFIGGSRLVVLDEPTTGVDPCSRRSIWDIIIQHKKHRTIILSTHHLDEAEVLSDRIAFLERGGLKCCGSPFYLKDKLARGYNLTLTKKVPMGLMQRQFDSAEVKAFIQSYMPDARLKEGDIGDQVYSLPPFSSSNAESYRSLLSSLDSNLERLQLGCYGISDTTLEEVRGFGDKASESQPKHTLLLDVFRLDSLTGSSEVHGLALIWRQMVAMLIKRVHHSRRDWKGLLSQVVLPVLFVFMAMGLGSIRSDLQNFPEMELSPALYNKGPQYSFFSNQNANSSNLVNTMMSFPGIDNGCLTNPDKPVCTRNTNSDSWETKGDSSVPFKSCNCTSNEQVCVNNQYQPPHKTNPSSQIVYNLTGINVENYLVSTANNYIRNRYGGFDFGDPLPTSLQMDLLDVPMNRTLSKVWYNPEGHHTMPAYLNSLNNFILRTSLSAGISVSSHPYPGVVHILVALCVLTGYSIMTASFVIYEVQEHHSGSKRLQHISGIGEPFYWAINFFYDMAFYMIPVALSVATVAAFQIPFLTDKQNLAAVSLLLVMFGFATFPWMYLLSGIFKDAEMAFISYVCINLFITINTIISTSIMYFLGQLNENNESIHEVYRILCYVFLIFPQFSFGNGLMELARVDMQVQILDVYGIDAYKNPFAMDMLGWMFISLFLQGFICFTLRLLLNKWLMRKARSLFFQRKAVSETVTMDEDEDVEAERRRMTSGAAVTDLLQVNQLTKVYQHMSKKIQAVKSLSVGIPAGECFGLLGVNGAGKTTTFKMLTGDISPTDGTAKIKDWDGMVDIINCRNEGINIGYCPQVDALDGLLTGEEHLYFYARIRGIANRDMDQVVSYLLKKLELGYHRHTITDSYSCGTRRKLSTALALIGHPHILLLDEPSSGMDPRSKRHLWKIISEEVKGKCAVVLTSHSMEECEALCTRLAIMVKGQFRCLGSLQHIKNRFGSGFTVKMYLAVSSCDVEVITNFMQHHFPSTYLKDQHSSMVEYHVPVAPGGVADIFDQLESNKVPLQIKHFSVSQTTLDEVSEGMGRKEETADSISLESIGASDT